VKALQEKECGEVETPEARRDEVIYSRRSVEDTRQQITYFRSGEKATECHVAGHTKPTCGPIRRVTQGS
jgi:hypothetical protein